MKKGLLMLLLAVVAGACAFALMRSYQSTKLSRGDGSWLDAMPELVWLQDELDLSEAQFTEVSKLHADYRPQCVAMCAQIEAAHHRLAEASSATDHLSPELEAAIEDHARLHAHCQEAMIEHLYRTAALLEPEQHSRYLELMLPYAIDFTLSEPNHGHAH